MLINAHSPTSIRRRVNLWATKTPYEALTFFYGEELLKKLHVSKIEKDDVTLMPYLLKSQNTAK